MLDKFLNRGAEEERQRLLDTIAKLEKDNDNLRKRLSKRETKAAEDPARRQELEESLNKALTKIQVLEHELEVSRMEETTGPCVKYGSHRLSQGESRDVISRLSSARSEKDDLLTVYGSPGDPGILSDVPLPEFADLIRGDRTGAGFALFCDRGSKLFPAFAVIPPFPVESSFAGKGNSFDTAGLAEIIDSDRAAAFVLAHAGESFIGIADAKNLIHGELVRSGVKEKHSKGGWSQKRFERLREEDIRHHVEKVREAFDSMLDSYPGIAEYLVLMGDQQLALAMTEGCIIRRITRTTDIKPDRHCGEALRKEIWSSVWFRL